MKETLKIAAGAVPTEYRADDFRMVADQSGDWYCAIQGGQVAEISVPSGEGMHDVIVRAHELVHAHLHRRRRRVPNTPAHQATATACTDAEVHAVLSAIIPDHIAGGFDEVMDNEGRQKLVALAKGECSAISAANFAIRTLCQDRRWPIDGARNLALEVGISKNEILRLRALGRDLGDVARRLGMSRALRSSQFRHLRELLHDTILGVMQRLVSAEQLAQQALSGEGMGQETMSDDTDNRMGGFPRPLIEGVADQKLEIIAPPRSVPTHAAEPTRKYSACGSRLSRRVPQALATQRADLLFSRYLRRGHGGTILIDASNSMQLSDKVLQEIILAAPLSQVGFYSGLDCRGKLVVVARHGKRVANLAEVIASNRMGSNEVDFPAISWLLRQAPPRILVSDENFIYTVGGVEIRDAAALALVRHAKLANKLSVIPNVYDVASSLQP